ncbi:MAG: O-antigen ligase family protein [Clostridia bacterium]|nr:O-antigen ligase family protein [Clostridia bacterium]
MTDRILTKKNLLTLGMLAAVMHAALGMLRYFFPASTLLERLMDVPLMLTAVFSVLYMLRRDAFPRPRPAQTLLLLFLGWLALSCLSVSFRQDPALGGDNTRPFVNAAVSCLLLFPLGCAAGEGKAPSPGKALLHACMLIWTAFILWALAVVFQGKIYRLPGGGYIAMVNDSLQLNCNRNTTGAWEMLFFLVSFLMILRCRRPAVKAVYGAALAIHYAALILSNSRTSIYAALPGLAALTFIGAFRLLKNQPFPRRALLSLALAAAAAAAFYLLREPVFRLYTACAKTTATDGARELTQTTGREMTGERLPVWKYTLQGIFSSVPRALLGVGPRGVPRLITLISGQYKNLYYSHNQVLEIAAAAGIPGVVLMLAWFALILRDMFRILFRRGGRALPLCLCALILVLALANMMEAYLIFYDYLGGYVFFFLCGAVHGAADREKAR